MKINNGRYPSRFPKELGHEPAGERRKEKKKRKRMDVGETSSTSRRSHSESNLLDARANRRNRAFTDGKERKAESGGKGRGRDGGEKETGKNEKLQVEVGFYA